MSKTRGQALSGAAGFFLAAFLAPVFLFAACESPVDNGERAITWTVLANGENGAQDSTALAITFSAAVEGLTADDITVADDSGSVAKGSVSSTDAVHWSLGITVAAEGNVKVSISKTGIETAVKDVAVYKTGAPVALAWTARADGAAGTATSTRIDFEFSGAVAELDADDISVTDDSGSVAKGDVSNTDAAHWSLGITVAAEGNVKVSISKTGIEDTVQDVAVHKTETPLLEVNSFPIASSSTGSSFLLKNDGTLWAVGYNQYGNFGNGTTIADSPYTTSAFTQVADHVVAVATGNIDTYIIKDDGSLWAAGNNQSNTHTSATSTFEQESVSGAKVVSLAVSGYDGMLVLMENGDVYARGNNTNGDLGTGTVLTVTEWTKVAEDVKQITMGSNFSLVLKNNGEVWGTGDGRFMGIGLGTKYLTFQKVFENAAAIAAGRNHSLVLKDDGTLWGAGLAARGKLGNGYTGIATDYNDTSAYYKSFTQLTDSDGMAISSASAISAGNMHSLILKTDGSVWGAGDLNFDFRDGSNGAKAGYFTRMVDSGVTKISAQGSQSFILKHDGTLWAAGNVNIGILGNTAATVYQEFTQIPLPE
ncbi:MAG: hypothetical protein LBG26_05925 [Treponema sp.]|jgi:alpha-tubulin suppressor-like RCC1 family protein|nr:hypothetical protein [Treponema sp.]